MNMAIFIVAAILAILSMFAVILFIIDEEWGEVIGASFSTIIWAVVAITMIGINQPNIDYRNIAYNQCIEQGYSEITRRGNGYYCLRFGLEPEMIYLTSIDDMQSDLQKGE